MSYSRAVKVSDASMGQESIGRLAVLPQVPNRLLYQLIVKQLQFDGYSVAASAVADATGVSEPAIEDKGDLLTEVVNAGLAYLRHESSGLRRLFDEQVVERYLNLSKVYAPLSVSHSFSIGRHMFSMVERFTTAVLGGVVRDVAFSPDGNCVSCCGTDGLSLLFSLESVQDAVGMSTAQSSIYGKAANKAKDSLVGVGSSVSHNANEYTDLALVRRFCEHTGAVEFMRFHPTQPILATGGTDGCLNLCEYAHPDVKVLLKTADSYPLRGGSFHPTGEYFLFVTDHTVPRLVNVRTGQVLTTIASGDGEGRATTGQVSAGLTSAAFSSDGRYFALSSLDGSWSLNDGVSGKCVFRTVDAHGSVPVTSATFSRTGQVVLTSGMDSVARLWDLRRLEGGVVSITASGTSGRVAEVMALGEPTKCEHRGIHACFSSDESHVLCQDATLCAVHNYSVYSGDISSTLTTLPSFMQRGLTASPFANLVVTGGDDRRLRLWVPSCLPA